MATARERGLAGLDRLERGFRAHAEKYLAEIPAREAWIEEQGIGPDHRPDLMTENRGPSAEELAETQTARADRIAATREWAAAQDDSWWYRRGRYSAEQFVKEFGRVTAEA